MEIRISGISEQDLDLFLLEELSENDLFRTWFLDRVKGWDSDFETLVSARRSVDHYDGESDLELEWSNTSDARAILLIENKIAAQFQPRQIDRYRGRAHEFVSQGRCSRCSVVLTAPAAYARATPAGFDAFVSYEDIADWIEKHADANPRAEYKLALLKTAISRGTLGYVPLADEPVSSFWKEYWKLVDVDAHQLRMREPSGKPAASGFVWFSPNDLDRRLRLCHKLARGFVDLHFGGWGRWTAELRARLADALENGMSVASTGNSAAVRLLVPRLNLSKPFETQTTLAAHGITAAKRLLEWAISHRVQLQAVLNSRPPTNPRGEKT